MSKTSVAAATIRKARTIWWNLMEIVHKNAKNKTSIHSKFSYRPEIDGIRALAIVAVIINHFNKDILPSGYLGVDIFFVISGFVITSSLAGRPSKNFSDFITGFYTRRIKRLIPALVLFVVVTSLLICLFNTSPGVFLRTGITSLFGLSNLYLLKQSTDYFATSTELNTFTHTWSLGVEEQFYFLFPLLAWLTGFSRQSTQGSRNLFWVTGTLSVASLVGFVFLYQTNQSAAYFLMPTRLWELGAGCLLFLEQRHLNGFLNGLESLPPLVVIASIVGVLFIPLQFAVAATIAVVVLTTVLISCLRPGTTGYKFFTHERIVYIGLISYSLYLWHWGVLSLSRWTIGIHWWSAPIQVSIMLLLAVSSYRYVEKPLRRSDWSVFRWKSISYGIGASASAAVFIMSLDKLPRLRDFFYTGSVPEMERKYIMSQSPRHKTNSCNIFKDKEESISLSDKCGFNARASQSTIFLVGDSHIQQFNKTIASHAKQNGLGFRSVWGNSCIFPSAVIRRDEIDCYKMQAKVENSLLATVRPGDTIFIGNALYARFSGYWEDGEIYKNMKNEPVPIKDAARQYSVRLRDLADQIAKKGAKVVILLDGAQFVNLTGGGLCYEQWFRLSLSKDCFIKKTTYLQRRDGDFGWIFKWENDVNKFAWDALDKTTCNHDLCRATHYRDNNHFAEYYADYIFSRFLYRHPNAI
jgi:peptidoglycan/LPS O-acetylase OafA/YrhL